MSRPRFHLAFPVDDLDKARAFYAGVLGCPEGRSDENWIDFDLYGHQIVAHLAKDQVAERSGNHVDGHDVPVPHFGLILTPVQWNQLAILLQAANADFIIAPTVRFKGQPGEQSIMFVRDPAGNALEFKAFEDDSQIFATE